MAFLNIDSRLELYDMISEGIKKIPNKPGANCFSSDGEPRNEYDLANVVNIQGRIGSDSQFGEIYKVDVNRVPFALKVIPVGAKKNTAIDWTLQEVSKEGKLLDKMVGIVERYESPNVPLSYGLFICNHCDYQNKNLIKRKAPKRCFIVTTELADGGDMAHWKKTKHSSLEWQSYIFQVLQGLAAVEQSEGLIHNDLHDGNILMSKVPKGGYWHYRFVLKQSSSHGGQSKTYDFYVPNTGQQWRLWDFGQSDSLKLTKGNFLRMFDKDVDNHIGTWVMEPPRKNEHFPRIPFSKSLEDDVYDALDETYARLKARGAKSAVPAFEMIYALGWFREKPHGSHQIINSRPYTINLREY